MIQLITESGAFHSTILKMKFDIQEAIHPYSFNEMLISSTPWMWKSI